VENPEKKTAMKLDKASHSKSIVQNRQNQRKKKKIAKNTKQNQSNTLSIIAANTK
jgi:hypothetical protein